jgi:hypothetical protein
MIRNRKPGEAAMNVEPFRNRPFARTRDAIPHRGLAHLALAMLAGMATVPAPAQVATTVLFDATTGALTQTERDDISACMRQAISEWASLLVIDGTRSIEVSIGVADIPTADGTSATTAYVGNVGGRDLYEQGLAHELHTGTDPNGVDPDVLVRFGLAYLRDELWFDPDPAHRTAPIEAGHTDATSICLHEAGHAIAYNGWADLVTGVPPATYWSTFDRWMIPGAPTLFSGPAVEAAWGSAPDLTTGNNKHWGNTPPAPAMIATPWRIETPVRWKNGVPLPVATPAPPSIDAPADAAGVEGAVSPLELQLMFGPYYYREHRYYISPLDVATLADVGLPLDRVFANGFD